MKRSPDDRLQSFVIRIWLEDMPAEQGDDHWRGQIVHVPSGSRRYFHSLDDVTAFIAANLEQHGLSQRPL